MLAAMGRYAEKYISGLPNFICLEVTEQYRSGLRRLHWKKGDTLTARLSYSQGFEKHTLEMVNNKPVFASFRGWRKPLTTEGEFGQVLARVFADDSEASFNWKGWDAIDGKRVAVFDYSIDKEHSTLRLTWSDLAKAVLAYHGSVYADPESGVVWRISNQASDIPAELHTREIGTTIDYGEVSISGRSYVLPAHATVLETSDEDRIRNELYFRNYQKFEAESKVTY